MKRMNFSTVLINLLLLLGEIDHSELPALIKAAAKTKIPVGRILVICQRLTEDELLTALAAAKLVISGRASLTKAAILLGYSYQWHIPVNIIDQCMAFHKANTVSMLLIAAGMLDTAKMLDYINARQGCGTVSGGDLYDAGLVSMEQWKEALEIAILIRRGLLNMSDLTCHVETGAEAQAKETKEAEEGSQGGKGGQSAAPRTGCLLGTLLLSSGLICEGDLMHALEAGLESGLMLGQILVGQGLISDINLNAVLDLQHQVNKSSITPAQAVSYLNLVPPPRVQHQALELAA